MIAVLDTNVVVSGVFFGGVPRTIMDAWWFGEFESAVTKSVLVEYQRVLIEMGERSGAEGEVERMIAGLLSLSIVIADRNLASPLCRDPEDDKFLVCAADAGAVVVSGDKDLIVLDGAMGVRVLTPRQFVAALKIQK